MYNFGCDESFHIRVKHFVLFQHFLTRKCSTDPFFYFAYSPAGSYRIEVSVSKSFLIRVNHFVLYCKATDIK
jgi:hypothetical protein